MSTYRSMQVHVSDGTLQGVSFVIPFLDVTHLHYYVDATEITSTSGHLGVFVQSVTPYGVVLTAAVPAGSVFKVLRQTPRVQVPHTFSTGAALFNSATTDQNNQYLLYVVQEGYEQVGLGPFPAANLPLRGDEVLTVTQGGVTSSTTVSDLLGALEDPDLGLLAGLASWDSAEFINALP